MTFALLSVYSVYKIIDKLLNLFLSCPLTDLEPSMKPFSYKYCLNIAQTPDNILIYPQNIFTACVSSFMGGDVP
jgi:hypothetical protein